MSPAAKSAKTTRSAASEETATFEAADVNADVAALSYEAARDELVEIVRRLESGGSTLEEALALWERGEALAARCETWLDGARERLDEAIARRQSQADPSAT